MIYARLVRCRFFLRFLLSPTSMLMAFHVIHCFLFFLLLFLATIKTRPKMGLAAAADDDDEEEVEEDTTTEEEEDEEKNIRRHIPCMALCR